MRKRWIKRTTIALFAAILLAASSNVVSVFALSEPENNVSNESKIEQQAQTWVSELASKVQYSDWKSAELNITPLGPGTHSWLVLLTKNKKILGYLVVNATEEGGLELGEYGTGEYPLFNEQSLQLSLLQLELINKPSQTEMVYVHPLQAAWRITSKKATHYTDANSGEYFPFDEDKWDKSATTQKNSNRHGLNSTHAKLIQHRTISSFDPYGRMPWISKQPIAIKDNDFTSILTAVKKKEQLRYTYEVDENNYRSVWSVVGYDQWENGELFVALDTDEDSVDRRYIPIALLTELGSFYR
ncbi:hypothetical protein [Paenibacillus sp. L3-i20]|uniref:hypothetical protein n=1 Tax=Paenibacillus sp. L3-i20 TaxID=2905833 RepID=UPI001EDE0452|nr:hypothetical protein [Paenibacillus sp. L3-i20]GKU78308.1 hypothetical protein L3i20_v227050 [Paenibacillus sp. L3-i20]